MNDGLATDELLYLPASEGSLPHITPAMVIDCLANLEIVAKPNKARRVFRWFISISHESTACTIPANMPDASLLFICSSRNAASFLEERPSAFALIQLEAGHSAEAFAAYAERCILIRKTERISFLTLLIQSYFIKILLWENDLKNIALRGGTIADMLDASTAVLKNFIFVSDNNFSVVARTTQVEPPDNLHRTIMSNGCLSQRIIAEKRFRLPEKTFYTRKASDITPFDRLSFPVHINHSYYGSISMVCNEYPDTEGLRGLFLTLVKAMQPVCTRLWSTNATFNLPSYFFFIKLIEHEEMSSAYLETQLEMAELNRTGHFKLILFDVDDSVDPDKAMAASRAATAINNGKIVCFPYKDHIVGFCYASQGDSELAHALTIKELNDRIYEPYGIECALSSLFTDITDLDLAYRQALITLGFRHLINFELFGGEGDERTGIYLFEEAMLYYLVDPYGKDDRFVRSIFAASIPRVLHEEDKENGTNLIALLWFWLKDERNATSVAKRLHMHRNTVLYHIGKLEKRFNFDMSKKTVRDWLLMHFKYFFLTVNDTSLANLLEEEWSDEGRAE